MPQPFFVTDPPPTSPAAISLDSGCCPCPQACGCTGLYIATQYLQGPGVTDAQAAPLRRLPFAKLDFTLTYAPAGLYVYYALLEDPLTLIREAVDLTPLVGVTDTLVLDSAAYNASYPTPSGLPHPVLRYAGVNWYTDGTWHSYPNPPGGSLFNDVGMTVWHDFMLASGRKVAVGLIVGVNCQSVGQDSNAFAIAGGFPGFEVANLRDAGGAPLDIQLFSPFAWTPIAMQFVGLFILRALEDFDWSYGPDPIFDNGGTQFGNPLPQHPFFVGFPGFGWKWLYHD
jgi:hypothetical protein